MANIREVARFVTLPEGELAVAFLDRHGVRAWLADRDMATINPDLLFALGGVRVVTTDDRVEEARRLIEGVRAGDFAEESDDWMEDATPGKVGELDEDEIHGAMEWSKRVGAVVVVLTFGFFLAARCTVIGP